MTPPVKRIQRRSQRLPRFRVEVLAPVAITALSFYFITAGIGLVAPRLALILVGLAAFLMLVWRLAVWDSHREIDAIEREYTVEAPQTPQRLAIVQSTGKAAATIKLGRFALTPAGLETLRQRVTEHPQQRMIRAHWEGLIPSLSVRWPIVLDDLQRLGLIDEEQQMTDDGWAWLNGSEDKND